MADGTKFRLPWPPSIVPSTVNRMKLATVVSGGTIAPSSMMQQSLSVHRRPWGWGGGKYNIKLENIVLLKYERNRFLPQRHSFQCRRTNPPMRPRPQLPRQWTHDPRCRAGKMPTLLTTNVSIKIFRESKTFHLPRAELFVRRSNDGPFIDHTVAAGFHIGQVTPDDGTRLDNHLAVQNYVLGAAQDGVSADLVSGCLYMYILKRKTKMLLTCRTVYDSGYVYRFHVLVLVEELIFEFHDWN